MSLLIRTWNGSLKQLSISNGSWIEPDSDLEIDLSRYWGLAGLADCHAHLAVDSLKDVSAAGEIEGIKRRAFAQLQSGVFLVIDKGWRDDVVLRLIETPPATRPELRAAGRIITGQHGYFPGFGVEVSDTELAAAVKESDPRGGWVKLIGDWPQKGRGPVINFSEGALADACRIAHQAELRVAIHTMGPDTPGMAVRAGCDSIEHGLYLTEGDLELLGSRGGAWVPTICNTEDVMSGFGPGSTAARVLGTGLENVRRLLPLAVDMGVAVLAGSDLGLPHGRVSLEAVRLQQYGLGARESVEAAGPRAYGYLGLPSLEIGASADLLLFDADPAENVSVLTRPVVGIRCGEVVFDHPGVLSEWGPV
ncbi:MAG TPA: amidohydrolase family protein [Acidimicrobiia bacterium]|nr:amidohydrolase family protein [Acidimicrobiia bacterium]